MEKHRLGEKPSFDVDARPILFQVEPLVESVVEERSLSVGRGGRIRFVQIELSMPISVVRWDQMQIFLSRPVRNIVQVDRSIVVTKVRLRPSIVVVVVQLQVQLLVDGDIGDELTKIFTFLVVLIVSEGLEGEIVGCRGKIS